MGLDTATTHPQKQQVKYYAPESGSGLNAEWYDVLPVELTAEEYAAIESAGLKKEVAERVKGSFSIQGMNIVDIANLLEVARSTYYEYKKALTTPTPNDSVLDMSAKTQDIDNQCPPVSADCPQRTPVVSAGQSTMMFVGWAVHINCAAKDRMLERVDANGRYTVTLLHTGETYRLIDGTMVPCPALHTPTLAVLRTWCWVLDNPQRIGAAFVLGGAAVQGGMLILASEEYLAECLIAWVGMIGGALNFGLVAFFVLASLYMTGCFLFENKKMELR